MNLRLDLYKIFCAVADAKSFSAAGKELYISQSAVSQAVKQLEDGLGVSLFCRSVRGVSLTEEGKILYEHVHSALGILETGEDKLQKRKNLLYGDLRIGVGDTISKHLLLDPLERFHSLYPDIKLAIFNRTSSQTVAMLKSGRVDIAFVNLPLSQDGELNTILYKEVQDIFVGGSRFEKYDGKEVPLSVIAKEPLILLEKNSNSRRFVEDFFHSQGVSIQPEIELGSHDLLLEFAAINLGIACVVEIFANSFLQSGQLREIKTVPPLPKRGIGICSLSGVSLSPAAAAFLELLLGNLDKGRE